MEMNVLREDENKEGERRMPIQESTSVLKIVEDPRDNMEIEEEVVGKIERKSTTSLEKILKVGKSLVLLTENFQSDEDSEEWGKRLLDMFEENGAREHNVDMVQETKIAEEQSTMVAQHTESTSVVPLRKIAR